MGPRRSPFRHAHHLVPGRRRSVHGLHVYRRAGARLRRRRHRVLRGALHDHDLSDLVSRVPAALVRLPQAQLHHRGRFRARPFRQSLAGAGRRGHRHRRHDAVHRAAAGRPAGGDRRHGRFGHRLLGRSAAADRLHHSRRFHLYEWAARASLDRHRQGHPDLHHRVCGHHRRADPHGRLRRDLRKDSAGQAAAGASRRQYDRDSTASMRRWRSARPWRCSSTRIPSPAF